MFWPMRWTTRRSASVDCGTYLDRLAPILSFGAATISEIAIKVRLLGRDRRAR
jgi:hypothetical protein